MGYDSGLTQANIALDAVSKRTVTSIEGEALNATTTTLGTVGAGKVWRIVSANLSMFYGNATGTGKILINGVAVLRCRVGGSATIVVNTAVSQKWDYTDCPVATAGQTVQISNDVANGQASGTVQYIEESA